MTRNSDVSNWEFNTKKPASPSTRIETSGYTIETVKYHAYFQNSKRNNSYNLKSNIFDKMLSDEMLIIQQNLHKKDINQIPSVHISTGNNAPTPTLEVKQKWSVMNFLSNALNETQKVSEVKRQNKTGNKIIKTNQYGDEYNKISCNNSKDKIVELRSLNDIVTHDIATPEYLENRLCTCMNTNTRCNHRCTAPNTIQDISQENSQSHGDTDHLCSRTVTNSNTQPNIPFYITTEMYNFYTVTPYPVYYPWLIDITKKKSKHRKNKHPQHLNAIYYDNSDEEIQNNSDYDDDIEKIKNELNSDDDEKKDKSKSKNMVINVEYENKDTLNNDKRDDIEDILEEGKIQVSNKDKFTNQIVSDLKQYYNDVVIKDCYCSSATRIMIRFQLLICIFLIMTMYKSY